MLHGMRSRPLLELAERKNSELLESPLLSIERFWPEQAYNRSHGSDRLKIRRALGTGRHEGSQIQLAAYK